MQSSPHLSVWRTIYFNFRTLPVKQAVKMPVRIFGKIKLSCLDGSVQLSSSKTRLKIGINWAGYRYVSPGRISIMKGARLILDNDVQISQGVSLLVHKNATLHLKSHCTVGDSSTIICYRDITIGRHSGITWQCQVMDFNSHYICNEKGLITSIISPIKIGDYCWIGNRTSVMPGTYLPDRTIVGSNSLLNKNYTATIPQYSLIAGIPAKLIKTGLRRIYDTVAEHKLMNYFAENITPLSGDAFPEEM